MLPLLTVTYSVVVYFSYLIYEQLRTISAFLVPNRRIYIHTEYNVTYKILQTVRLHTHMYGPQQSTPFDHTARGVFLPAACFSTDQVNPHRRKRL